MAEFLFGPSPNDDAREFLESKPVVSREVFDQMLPEVRGRTFLITGIEDASLVQDIRDRIADLTSGDDWDSIKKEVAAHLSPWLGDDATGRAELLLRTHGYQAYAAAEKQVLDRQRDVFPFLMYQAAGDDRVRDSHQALDGKVLPADSPFWETHYPPWEFGCRCQVVPLQREDVEDMQAEDADLPPEAHRVLDETRLREIEAGTLRTVGEGNIPRQVDVRSPGEKMSGSGFSASPGSLRIPLEDLSRRYEGPVWQNFQAMAERENLDDGRSVMEWLQGRAPEPTELAPHLAKALEDYTAMGSGIPLNESLRRARPPAAALEEARLIDDALSHLPPVKGEVFRYIDEPDPTRLEEWLRPGATVQEPAYLSASRDPARAEIGDAVITIRSRNGKDIAAHSASAVEQEVLFGRNSRFRIISVNRDPDGRPRIVAEEI